MSRVDYNHINSFSYHRIYFHYSIYSHHFSYFFQVRIALGIVDHVWQDKRAAIAATVDNLGDGFRPALCNGWLAYTKRAYPAGAGAHNAAIGQSESVVDDSDTELAGAGPA